VSTFNLDTDAAPDGASAVDRVYEPVASAIVSGALPAGSLITEGEIAAELGVSRTPVREAFLLLEARGMLRLFPKKGAIVSALDDTQVRELVDVRIMLESTAVQLAAARGEPGSIRSDLERLIGEQQHAAAAADLLAFARADHRFHARMVEEARNAVIDGFYATLGPRLERMTHLVITRDAAQLDDFITEHRALAEHMATGRPHEYEQALRDHVQTRHRA